jgi:hypothetical protein
MPIDEANPVDRFETSTAKNTTPAVVAMAVHTTSSANERRSNTARGGKICGRRIETALEPENGVCLIDLPGRDTQLEETEISLFIRYPISKCLCSALYNPPMLLS